MWIFGWDLNRSADVAEITQVLEVAAKHDLNGAVMSLGLDTLCKKGPEYFQRLDAIHEVCQKNRLEFVPAIFSVGYGGAVLVHDRNLAEGLPVEDATFVVTPPEGDVSPRQ